MPFHTLIANATDLQKLLEENKTTSVQILYECFAQIDRHEPALNALISPAPRDNVLAIARVLDQERQEGKLRSPFHGIPIILKDSFVTASDLGMSTTAGSRAFIGSKASKNGAITQRLINAGLIILGKGNMSVCNASRLGQIPTLIVALGVCWHENDYNDAWLVRSRRTAVVTLCRKDKGE
jgi:amidase